MGEWAKSEGEVSVRARGRIALKGGCCDPDKLYVHHTQPTAERR